MTGSNAKGPGAAVTAHRAESAAFGKPTKHVSAICQRDASALPGCEVRA